MTNKNFLNKLEELKPEVPIQLTVEKQLLPRLKFMAYLMFALALFSSGFAYFIEAEESVATELADSGFPDNLEAISPLLLSEEPEYKASEVLNFYVVGAIFAAIGVSLLLIAKYKRKKLSSHLHHN